MENGYYWLFLKNWEPKVVQILNNRMYHCGVEISADLRNGRWYEMDDALDVIALIGPIQPPKIDKHKNPVFKFSLNGLEKELVLPLNRVVMEVDYDSLVAMVGFPMVFNYLVEYEYQGETGTLNPGVTKQFHISDNPSFTVKKI